jgi:hypothetical protein
MKNLSIERLRAALAEEYPPGQVVLRAHDARALLALLDEGEDPGPEPDPDAGEAPGGVDDQGFIREPCCTIGPWGHEPGCPG